MMYSFFVILSLPEDDKEGYFRFNSAVIGLRRFS